MIPHFAKHSHAKKATAAVASCLVASTTSRDTDVRVEEHGAVRRSTSTTTTTCRCDEAPTKHQTFHDRCPKTQTLPKVPYPAWEYDWDGRLTPRTSLESMRTVDGLKASKSGTTRHIIMVRHGQYDMSHPDDDEKCTLTALGRRQALRTGQRIALMTQQLQTPVTTDGSNASAIWISAIHQSNMARAKETASIIASQLPTVELHHPDASLNEAIPAPMIPLRPDVPNAKQEIDEHHERIEEAFRKYFWRAVNTKSDGDGADESATRSEVHQQHEFEIIVGHANIIRYFVCRALQLPPEAWLRMSIFNCSMTYIMIQPNGYVTVRLLGDTGHLPYEETTFSGNHGWNWS
ncbi:hypothetical protein MPSEU_000257700 [Mayamaea pseudoterrestris]|nr:hypothetical protein MPSEU_000257700 [Mayamaea pseudoterrestris]